MTTNWTKSHFMRELMSVVASLNKTIVSSSSVSDLNHQVVETLRCNGFFPHNFDVEQDKDNAVVIAVLSILTKAHDHRRTATSLAVINSIQVQIEIEEAWETYNQMNSPRS